MRINHIGILITAIFLIISCHGKKKQEGKLEMFLNSTELHLNRFINKAVIILPIDGCSGCIATTSDFIRKNQDPLLFCIVSSPTRKEAKFQLGELLNSDRICIDIGLKARLAGIISYYPVLFYIEGDRTIAQEVNATNVESELLYLKLKLQSWNEKSIRGN